ncbi:multiple sugar transport system substrate-binding protein [Isoptericola sp. CG 20/1183]|uniref:Multiple sugar transport system substrate-binding protein n=1 Tax=Isoptericola halotolerans TaxID=300560 RepID=A0ABX5EKB2_9MICO|nr:MULTISPECIES: extracellular solute-binding protein [Isoptericola]MCK0118219.1 extracellular solute-binding protein [Isoptericola sp. S6320L]PRZ02501.1 multiple sugar transport system substrate-binding protein [Isoptericola sp. CG 20/1183]PRZ09297.1 multiple sugar transport system substrate-binding protein [Isoptericola sp. CG 20/1183]PRZ10098.1 multiple sugar transport system substrate-binding protein [Isoptericola halotolerans]
MVTMTGRRVRGGTAVLAASALALTGCAGGADGDAGDDGAATITFAWWGDATRADRYEEAIDLFEEQNPGVTIQTSYAGWGDYWTARNTEAAGGALPDVFQMDVAYLRQYGATGQIQPLDQYVGEQIDISSFPESVMPATKIDDQIYGIPTQTTILGTFFNNDLLDQVGVDVPSGDLTWDEYDAFLGEVGAAGADADPRIEGSVQYVQIWSVFEIWLLQQGKSLYAEDGGFGFTEADLAAWWGRAAPLFANGGFMDPGRAEQIESDPLSAQYTASEISFYNFLVRFTEGTGGDEFSMTGVPADDPANRGVYLKPGLQLSMSAQTEHPEVTAEFIDFLTNDPAVEEIFEMSRGVPISAGAREGIQAEGLDQEILAYWESVEATAIDAPAPPPQGAGAVEAEFTRIAQDIGFGALSVEDGVEQFFLAGTDLLG